MKKSSWIERVGKLVKYWCRTKIDSSSWLEIAGPEEYWYCEERRKFRFRREVTGRNSVVVHLTNDVVWETGEHPTPLEAEDLRAIGGKLQEHFRKTWGDCEIS